MIVKGFEEKRVIKIDNARVYGLDESIIASGYPMQAETHDMELIHEPSEKDLKRIKKLGSCKGGTGHDAALKGITVQFDLQVSEYIFRQLDRYHFIDHVSSQSKMHRILKMDIDKACNKYVRSSIIEELKELISIYNDFDWYYKRDKFDTEFLLRDETWCNYSKEELFNIIIANCPCGIMLTSRMTTNYLQLKTIYHQRKNHKMQEHRLFCKWIENLPLMKDILEIEEK